MQLGKVQSCPDKFLVACPGGFLHLWVIPLLCETLDVICHFVMWHRAQWYQSLCQRHANLWELSHLLQMVLCTETDIENYDVLYMPW